MNKIPMTQTGAEALRVELKKLKSVERPIVIQAIAEAREHGDLKENAEYHAAREKQGFIEGRIADIESKLALAQIINVAELANQDRIVFGATVKLVNVDTDATVSYQIVGEDEANIKAGKISVSSPLGRAMIGKQQDDEVVVHAPSGNITYEVLGFSYS